jgi:hypothetical protein
MPEEFLMKRALDNLAQKLPNRVANPTNSSATAATASSHGTPGYGWAARGNEPEHRLGIKGYDKVEELSPEFRMDLTSG